MSGSSLTLILLLHTVPFQKCWYCGHANASIYCAKPGCRRVFHLTCGVESGCLSQFLGTFDSYCHRHNTEYRYKDYKEATCVICSDALNFTCDGIQNDCCNGVFHRRCLGSLALSAGYFFKCPLCANTEQFRKCMRQKGVYVPDRDASWELENNAFNELHAPTYSCEAVKCLSKQGRKFNSVDGFAFMSCSSCGAGSIHRKCCNTPDFVCALCCDLFKDTAAATAADNTLSDLTLQNMIQEVDEATAAVAGEEQAEPSSASRRRSARHSVQRQESPEKGSPFKVPVNTPNRRRTGTDRPMKRRRLC